MEPGYFMVNWSKRPVVGEHMIVVRQVAVQLLTGIFEAERVRFSHDLCEGMVTKKGTGVFANTGGTYFLAKYSDEYTELYDVEFFIPRGSERQSLREQFVFGQIYDEQGMPQGYPLDADTEAVFRGGLRIKAMRGS